MDASISAATWSFLSPFTVKLQVSFWPGCNLSLKVLVSMVSSFFGYGTSIWTVPFKNWLRFTNWYNTVNPPKSASVTGISKVLVSFESRTTSCFTISYFLITVTVTERSFEADLFATVLFRPAGSPFYRYW